jgi:RNA polymerase sigma-70 factor (ECF subfamily)
VIAASPQSQTASDTTFEEFVSAVAPDLLAYFRRRVSPAEDAADCLSETLLALWRGQHRIPPDIADSRPWAFGVARGILRNHQRSEIRRSRVADRLRAAVATAEPTMPAHDQTELLEMLASLDDISRELITLVAWEGFTVAAAAQVLGLSQTAARARYSRARRKLRRAFEL